MRAIDADKLLRDIEKYHVSDGKFQHWVQIQPTIEPETCENAVSRNAIIQKLNTMDRYVSEELILCDTDKKFPKNEVFIVDDVYEEIVENLSSMQPERKKGKWIKITQGAIPEIYMCPFCNRTLKDSGIDALVPIRYPFCHCGADMRE